MALREAPQQVPNLLERHEMLGVQVDYCGQALGVFGVEIPGPVASHVDRRRQHPMKEGRVVELEVSARDLETVELLHQLKEGLGADHEVGVPLEAQLAKSFGEVELPPVGVGLPLHSISIMH